MSSIFINFITYFKSEISVYKRHNENIIIMYYSLSLFGTGSQIKSNRPIWNILSRIWGQKIFDSYHKRINNKLGLPGHVEAGSWNLYRSCHTDHMGSGLPDVWIPRVVWEIFWLWPDNHTGHMGIAHLIRELPIIDFAYPNKKGLSDKTLVVV